MLKCLYYTLWIICIAALIVAAVTLVITGQPIQKPFAPPEFDSQAVVGVPDVADALGWQELDAKAYRVGICGLLIPKGNDVDVWFTNPKENKVWLKVRVFNGNGDILGESGLIRPGEYLQTINLQTVPNSGSTVALKIMAYEPETYYSAGAVTLTTQIS